MSSPPEDRLGELLQEDHERLDRLLDAFRTSTPEPSQVRRARFAPFDQGLRQHIRFEEERLFPALQEGGSVGSPAIDLLIDEHRRILDVLQRIRGRLEGDSGSAELEEELVNVLWAHNAREEGALYPALVRTLPPAVNGKLARAFLILTTGGATE